MADSPARKLADLLNDTQSANQVVQTDGSGALSFTANYASWNLLETIDMTNGGANDLNVILSTQDNALGDANQVLIWCDGLDHLAGTTTASISFRMYESGVEQALSTSYNTGTGDNNNVFIATVNHSVTYDLFIVLTKLLSGRYEINAMMIQNPVGSPNGTEALDLLNITGLKYTDFDRFKIYTNGNNFDGGTMKIYTR